MCGILGIYQPGGRFDPGDSERRLREACELLRHRGPDASGVVLKPEAGLGFGHRRLAILDLDTRANQPMVSADGRRLITFNGEIYNFRELRDDLRRSGASFRTESDTEVLLEGFRIWELEGLLSRVAGMFAFALYDAKDKRLILARDRAGKKPLFYTDDGNGLRFCSELRGLLRLFPARVELDPAGLDSYLALKFTPPPRTLIRGVSKVPPACYLEKIGDKPARIKRYWSPWSHASAGRIGHSAPAGAEGSGLACTVDASVSPVGADASVSQAGAAGSASSIRGAGSVPEILDRLDAALATAVKRRLVSDVPVCLFLSGGVDSSLIASHLARSGVRDMTAYSIGYGDLPAYNEFEYSRLVAKRFPIRHEELVLQSREALETLEDGAAALDEPISDWIWMPLHHLSRRAHQDGFKVVLVGEGSDEIFFGYDVMMKGLADLRRFKKPLPKAMARVGAPLLAPIYRLSRKGHRRYDLLRRVAAGEPVYMGSSVGFGASQRHQIAGPRLFSSQNSGEATPFIASVQQEYREHAPDAGDDANLICYTEFRTKMTEVLLQRVDRVSMLQSLEARSPYLDHELVELAFSIPGDRKIPGGRLKGLLKELAVRDLPQEIVRRKKMGFSFPFKEWLRGDLGFLVDYTFRKSRLFQDGWLNAEFCRTLLAEHRSGWFDHAPRLWMIFDLCRWYDRWIP